MNVKPYIIAEFGVNHEGDPAKCFKAIEAVKASGANAIKFQHYIPQELFPDKPERKKWELPKHTWEMIAKMCDKGKLDWGISLFCSTWNMAPWFLDLGIKFLKVASREINVWPKITKKVKCPWWIISTGYLDNVQLWPVSTETRMLDADINFTMLACKSDYPCKTPPLLRIRPGMIDGYSCHTEGDWAMKASVSLGASTLEKHFTLSHDDYQISGFRDHVHAWDPKELNEFMGWLDEYTNSVGS